MRNAIVNFEDCRHPFGFFRFDGRSGQSRFFCLGQTPGFFAYEFSWSPEICGNSPEAPFKRTPSLSIPRLCITVNPTLSSKALVWH